MIDCITYTTDSANIQYATYTTYDTYHIQLYIYAHHSLFTQKNTNNYNVQRLESEAWENMTPVQ